MSEAKQTVDLSAEWGDGVNPLGLRNLEVAAGMVCDTERRWLQTTTQDQTPLAALEAVLLPLLTKPPVVIAFSGGRDSSVLLATATRLARIHGLPLPAAVTASWSNDKDSDERRWQEAVIRTVDVDSWERFDPGDDLDLLGPVARTALVRHGLFWPAPAYALIPLLQRAKGGTLLSGEGGDEVFGGGWALSSMRGSLRDRHWPRQSELRDVLVRCAPYQVRRRRAHHWIRPYQEWLRPPGADAHRQDLASEWATYPLRWRRHVARQASVRSLQLTIRTLQRFAVAEGARFVAPLVASRFVAAIGAAGRLSGFADRTATLQACFCEILPPAILTRTSKATFGRVFWGPESRDFARTWEGQGLAPQVVDHDKLREAWLMPVPVYAGALPLHAAWLASKSNDKTTPRGFCRVGNDAVGV